MLGVLVVIAAIAAILGDQSPESSSSTGASPIEVVRPEPRGESRESDRPEEANLDPALLDALRRARTDAAEDGVELVVNSGWRSEEYQAQLLREAISKYGSEAEAARWVATGTTSPHVSGDAVDLGPPAATAWLSEHGDDYGLCQI